jgi:hypothetical protein
MVAVRGPDFMAHPLHIHIHTSLLFVVADCPECPIFGIANNIER